MGVILCPLSFPSRLSSHSLTHGGFPKPRLLHHQCACGSVASRVVSAPFRSEFSVFLNSLCSFSTSIYGKGPDACTLHENDDERSGDEHEEFGDDEENDDFEGQRTSVLDNFYFHSCDLETIIGILQGSRTDVLRMKDKLEQCGVRVTSGLVVEVLSRVRNDWEAAFTFFLWAGKQPGYAHSVRQYHSMIAILGKMRKFDTAWSLIDEMKRGGSGSGHSLVTPQTLLIMIRRYCAVHDVGKAISTFYAYRRFKLEITMEEFQNLLSALCRYKNVKDAEHLLFCNKNDFPLNTKSMNIILNGWSNIVGDLREAKRIWREMKSRGIPRDVFAYSSMLSCYSKYGKLQDVLKLFDQMKAMDIAPDRKVYNAVIHAVAKAKHVKEARNLMKKMEESGISPDVVTYNSLIMPLCRKRQPVEAREVFYEMIARGMSPTARTYHAFFRILRTGEEVFELLERMKTMGCNPGHDTYIMLIRKFSRWREIDIVFKLWNEMRSYGLDHDRSSYIVLIHGLFLNGKLEESYQYYLEMKRKHLLPEPKIEKMLQIWLEGKQNVGDQMADLNEIPVSHALHTNRVGDRFTKFDGRRDFIRQPETRKVTRERGFSFFE